MPMPPPSAFTDANVRSQTYYVARTTAQCWRCGSPTCVLALALPPSHDTLEGNDTGLEEDDTSGGPDDAQPAPGMWQRADANAFLFYVERLPDEVQRRLHELSRSFHVAQSPATHSSYWGNHCEHCSALLGDHELHCEPDGAFAPSNEAAAANIELLEINEPFEAAVAGYALEPEFFRCMRGS
jgi:hypothetical protein